MPPQLIETLRVDRQGRVPLLDAHLARLARSSIVLGYVFAESAVRDAIAAACASLPQGEEHRLRLLLSRHGELSISTAPLPALPAAPRVALASERLPSETAWLRHKTTHRPWYAAATDWLVQHPDYFDLIFCNQHDQLCEGSRSNVYLLLDGHWCTPPVTCGLLPGVQRAQILAAGQAVERVLTRNDLHRAQAVRVSNALRGWLAVEVGAVLMGQSLPETPPDYPGASVLRRPFRPTTRRCATTGGA